MFYDTDSKLDAVGSEELRSFPSQTASSVVQIGNFTRTPLGERAGAYGSLDALSQRLPCPGLYSMHTLWASSFYILTHINPDKCFDAWAL